MFFTYLFVCFNLSTIQSTAFINKLTDKQKNLKASYYNCIKERKDRYFYSIKFRLKDIPETTQEMEDCGTKYSKLIYNSFDSIQERDHYYDYHQFRYKIGEILIDSKDENQVIKGLKHLDKMFNDPVYEKNILLDGYTNINDFKLYVATNLGWIYNSKINFYDKKKAFEYMQYCPENKEDSHGSVYIQYCLNNLGSVYDQKNDYKKAYELYKKSAHMGNHYANANLAKFYLLGLGGIEKSYEKAIRYYKLARIADLGDEQFIDLLILYDKGRLPKNISEHMEWLEKFIIRGKDAYGFQQLAWLANDNQSNINGKIASYKWHYLSSKYSSDKDDKKRSLQEMHIMEKESLNEKQINEAVMQAEAWIEKNWKN